VKPIKSIVFRAKLGKKVRKLRKEQKITQAQLAFECGLSREQIYRLELGHKNITLDSLIAITNALEITLEELFKGF
jgi:XRE family transcriptional regulator, regulator of sulfur utilization